MYGGRGKDDWDVSGDLCAFYPEIFAYSCGFNEAEELEVHNF
jgi:hypothetical protein